MKPSSRREAGHSTAQHNGGLGNKVTEGKILELAPGGAGGAVWQRLEGVDLSHHLSGL